jgi:hypothetical protein
MLRKVLLLSASAGAGHVRAAQVLEKAFQIAGEATGEIREVQQLEAAHDIVEKLIRLN